VVAELAVVAVPLPVSVPVLFPVAVFVVSEVAETALVELAVWG